MAQAVLATDDPDDGPPDCLPHQADCLPHQAVLATDDPDDGPPDCLPHQADCLPSPQRRKCEHLHAAVAGHGSVPVAMPRTLRQQAHSPDEGGNQPDERGTQGGHQHALGVVATLGTTLIRVGRRGGHAPQVALSARRDGRAPSRAPSRAHASTRRACLMREVIRQPISRNQWHSGPRGVPDEGGHQRGHQRGNHRRN